MHTIYVRLMNEGSSSSRPVPALKISEQIYQIDGAAPYDTDDETWEFTPGSQVVVEARIYQGQKYLLALRLAE